MKTTICCLLAILVLHPFTARAEDSMVTATRGRGWLTGVGLGLTAVGLGLMGLGIGATLTAHDAGDTFNAYYANNNNAPRVDEAQVVIDLEKRAQPARALAVAGFVLGAAALAGAGACLILDGEAAGRPLEVALGVTPREAGASLVLVGRF